MIRSQKWFLHFCKSLSDFMHVLLLFGLLSQCHSSLTGCRFFKNSYQFSENAYLSDKFLTRFPLQEFSYRCENLPGININWVLPADTHAQKPPIKTCFRDCLNHLNLKKHLNPKIRSPDFTHIWSSLQRHILGWNIYLLKLSNWC